MSEELDPKEQEKRFKTWLGSALTPGTITSYVRSMKSGFSKKRFSNFSDVFVIQDTKSLKEYMDCLNNESWYASLDHGACKAGFNKYMSFLENPELPAVSTSFQNDKPRNRIVFGAPGTGKSYKLNKELEEFLGKENEDYYERVTFHPDYSYANFVGTYKPVPCKDSNGYDAITYEYVPGPFMRIYVRALENPLKPYLLIIEEINRANVASVFGDVFQLLDRGEDGESRYPIQASEDIRKFLEKNKKLSKEIGDFSKIKIPGNMFIWATMNSADQGVFPMDTAFKRRWDFEYIGIDEGESSIKEKYVLFGKSKEQKKVEWNSLRKAINDFLAKEDINEDKQLGPYFISVPFNSNKEIDSEKFCEMFKSKVIMYLFEDAARQKRNKLFLGCSDEDRKRYSSICREFDEKGIKIFCQDIIQKVLEEPLEESVVNNSE